MTPTSLPEDVAVKPCRCCQHPVADSQDIQDDEVVCQDCEEYCGQ